MSKELRILLVEDNYEHLKLTRYLLQQNRVPGEVFVVRDGQEAIDFLYRRNQFSDAAKSPRPHIVLLDLNIPRINGKEVLRTIKTDDRLQDIPVVVFSSSDRQEDIQYAQENGAAAYISKSGGFEQLGQALASLPQYASRDKR